MKLRHFGFKVFLTTSFCFFMSYLCAAIAGGPRDVPYPLSLAKVYSVKLNHETPVHIKKSFPAENISEIGVMASQTDIDLIPTDGSEVIVELTGEYSDPNDDTDKLIATQMRDGKLSITVDGERYNGGSFFKFQYNPTHGKMVIWIPHSLQAVLVKAYASNVSAHGLESKFFMLQTASGDINLMDLKSPDFQLKSISGDITLTGSVENLNAQTVSGDIALSVDNTSPRIEAKTTSGDVEVSSASDLNAKIDFSSVSGQIQLENGKAERSSQWDGRRASLTLGAGLGLISVKSVSGDLRILRE
jgi:hypothetical protein